jgi:DNA relaxase NicK
MANQRPAASKPSNFTDSHAAIGGGVGPCDLGARVACPKGVGADPAPAFGPLTPPSSNTGGKVSGGHKSEACGEAVTTIDWLRFRCKNSPSAILEALRPVWRLTDPDLVTFRPGLKGMDGWTMAGQLVLAGDIVLGRIDYGGDSQRGWVRVNITGSACAEWVEHWDAVVGLQHSLTEPELQRVDIALTTYNGEVTTAMVEAAHDGGRFTCGGRPPRMNCVGERNNARSGQTRYVGSRSGHKFLRCYEKGFEQIKDLPDSLASGVTHIAHPFLGTMHRVQDIYRVELELKAVDKVIPWEVIRGRDSVFASAYPFCAELLPGLPVWRMAKIPDFKPIAAIDTMREHCRRGFGPFMRTLLEINGGDKAKTLDMVIGSEPSYRLVETGALTVEYA